MHISRQPDNRSALENLLEIKRGLERQDNRALEDVIRALGDVIEWLEGSIRNACDQCSSKPTHLLCDEHFDEAIAYECSLEWLNERAQKGGE